MRRTCPNADRVADLAGLWPRATVLAIAAFVAAAGSSCEQPGSSAESPPDIVFITLDTLRADHLGCYGYFRDTSPALDALAAESIVFESCYTPVAQTLPTHTTIFTGLDPREHGIASNFAKGSGVFAPSPLVRMFADALLEGGYETAAFVSAEPVKRESGIATGFRAWHEPDEYEVGADVTIDRVLEWLESPPAQPYLLWVHLFDPHLPYAPPTPYDEMFEGDGDAQLSAYFETRGIPETFSRPRDRDKTRSSRREHDLYDGEIRFVDAQLGRLFDRLRSLDSWGDTAIVLTSDHGEGMNQHGAFGHERVWLEQLAVPLVMRIPGRLTERIDSRLSSRDILPTLIALLPGLPPSELSLQFSGSDVLSPDWSPTPLYGQTPGLRRDRKGSRFKEAILYEDWRFVTGIDAPPELYRLGVDPHERENVAGEYPDVVERLTEILEDRAAAQDKTRVQFRAGGTRPVSPERRAGLESLGYTSEE